MILLYSSIPKLYEMMSFTASIATITPLPLMDLLRRHCGEAHRDEMVPLTPGCIAIGEILIMHRGP